MTPMPAPVALASEALLLQGCRPCQQPGRDGAHSTATACEPLGSNEACTSHEGVRTCSSRYPCMQVFLLQGMGTNLRPLSARCLSAMCMTSSWYTKL